MRRDAWLVAMALGAAALLATGTVHSAPSSGLAVAAYAPCTPTWRTAESPRVAQGTLNGVAALSTKNAWAVGGIVRLGGDSGGEVVSSTPLIEHWNGTRWSVAPSPQISGDLTDIAAISPRDVWAVGFVPRTNGPFTLHWDGRRWATVELPSSVHATTAIAALSRNDVWVVGTLYVGFSTIGEISHWDGSRWTSVSRPNSALHDVDAVSPRDIWAVGATPGDELGNALMLHWDGVRWKPFVRAPTSGTDDAWLRAVHARSSTDVWAGGGEHEAEMSPPAIGPLMLHWNGSRWLPSPLSSSGETEFGAITAPSASEAWAVSHNDWSYELQGGFGYATWQRSGQRWRATGLPRGWELYDIAAAPSGGGPSTRTVWAVGQVGTRIQDYATRTVPLIRRYGC